MKNRQKWLLIITLVALAAAWHWLGAGDYLTLDNLKAQQQAITHWTSANLGLAAALYLLVYILVTALSLPGAAVMTLAGGALFGLPLGVALVSIASTIGATLAFLIARYLLREWVREKFGDRLKAIDAGIEKDGAFYLLGLRLVPVFPFFIVNIVMALTPIRAWTYFWVSWLGMLPATFVYVYAGTQLARIESLRDIFSPGMLLAFSLLGLFPLLARFLLRLLEQRRHYARWPRPRHFDRNLIVIGAGAGGLVSAYIGAALKAKVTLIEKNRMGGDCLNTGCVPSKALLRTAGFFANVKRAKALGVESADATIDFATVMARVRRVIDSIAPHDSVERYTRLGVEVIEGTARLESPWTVRIDTGDGQRRLSARSIVIATGARPFVPPIPGIEAIDYRTSDTIWQLDTLPRRLLVLGGGPIGCELAQAFSRLGSEVTVVEMAPRLLIRETPEVSALLAERFEQEGIRLLTNHRAAAFGNAQGNKTLRCEHIEDGSAVEVAFDEVLIAVGRRANTDDLGLEALGITLRDNGTIETNDFLQTRYPNIYAVGDVAGPYQFTHTASHQAWYAAVNALFDPLKKFRADYRVIPWATFTDPEIARVGLNRLEAELRNIPHEVTRYNIDDLDRAITDEAAEGFIEVVTAKGKDKILGVTIVGQHAAEIISEYVLAMKHGLGLNKILGTIHIYPTMAEANKYVAGQWKKAHAPKRLLQWLSKFHQWKRKNPPLPPRGEG